MTAGKMRAKLAFQKRSAGGDGYGQPTVGDFATAFEEFAELIPRLGSEPVFASRLQGVQPFTIRIRSSIRSREIDATWRAVDARGATVYSIVSPPINISQKNDYIDILATVGTSGQ